MRDENLLKQLTQLWGVSGYEKEVAAFIEKEAAPYADEIIRDAVGNLIVRKKGTGGGKGKRIMFAAHMDEIGFMVKKIESDGRLRVCSLGWNWTGSAYNSRVRFKNGMTGKAVHRYRRDVEGRRAAVREHRRSMRIYGGISVPEK